MTTLDVPFVSQLGGSAALSNNDCLIASLLMLVRYWFRQQGLLVPIVPSVDDLIKYTPLGQPNPPKGLTFAQGIALARLLGFPAAYVQPVTESALTRILDAGSPIAVLLDYSAYNPSGAKIAHILVVHSYDAEYFWTHDPYLLGANVKLKRVQLMAAMKSSPGNSIGFQGMVLAV